MCAARRCPPGTFCRRKCRIKRWRRCWRFYSARLKPSRSAETARRARRSDRPVAELLEVLQALVAPRRCIGGLAAQLREHCVVALVVDAAPQRLPPRQHRLRAVGAASIAIDEL